MKPLTPGQSWRGDILPDVEHLASSVGNPGIHVVSSPWTICYLEVAAHNLVDGYLEPGEGTVGTGFDLEHISAARLGEPISLYAEITEIDLPTLTLNVQARQNGKLVMNGVHRRAVVDKARLLKRQGDTPAPELTFWFDVHSPWACLAANRIGSIARDCEATVKFKPVHLPTLSKTIDGRRPSEANKAFRDWFDQDLLDHARLQNFDLNYHPDYPLRNSRALRACIYAEEQGEGEAFVVAVMRAYWSTGRDISELSVLSDIGESLNLNPDLVSQAATGDVYRDRLRTNTEAAIKRGVFGVPTVDTGDKLYFGNDRLDLMKHHLIEAAALGKTVTA